MHDNRTIDFCKETRRNIGVVRYNGIGVMRTMPCNMLHGFVDPRNDPSGNYRIEIFCIPISVLRRYRSVIQFHQRIIGTYFATGIDQRGNKIAGHAVILIDKDRLGRTAYPRSAHLGIDDDRLGHRRIGILMDIGMTNAVEMREHRHSRFVLYPCHQ